MPSSAEVILGVPEVFIDHKTAPDLRAEILSKGLHELDSPLGKFMAGIIAGFKDCTTHTYTFTLPLRGTDPHGGDVLIVSGDQTSILSGQMLTIPGHTIPVVSVHYDLTRDWTIIKFAPNSLPKDRLSKVTFTGPPPAPAAVVVEPVPEIVLPPDFAPTPVEIAEITAASPGEAVPVTIIPPSLLSRIRSFFTRK
jgi:hypothetical protein